MADVTDMVRSIAVIVAATDTTPTEVSAPIVTEQARKIAPIATVTDILKKRRMRTNIAAEATASAVLVKFI